MWEGHMDVGNAILWGPRAELGEVGKGSMMIGYVVVLGLGSDHWGLSL